MRVTLRKKPSKGYAYTWLDEVNTPSNRHYTLTVNSNTFDGLTQVKQHPLVYAAIAGNDAPIHAIDQINIQTS